jgi:hypothetical protein
MAEIVLGMGTSHGPMLSLLPEQWDLRAKFDRENKQHFYRGKTYDYDSLLKERAPGFARELVIETRRERYERCQKALDALGNRFRSVAPEALVIVGNDQREMFDDELTPSITIYRASQIVNAPQTKPELTPGLAIAEKGNCPAEGAVYPGAAGLADHITEFLQDRDFDLAQCSNIPGTAYRKGIPHAYGFVYHRVLQDAPPPSVPIVFNVHYPHNRARQRRCLALGHALKDAIASFTGCARVALLASGGLTHFVIDEEMDQAILKAMETGDEEALTSFPESYFESGTAEIKNWLTVIGAMNAAAKRFHLVDYVPCYRSEAGTGNAMGFVYWD